MPLIAGRVREIGLIDRRSRPRDTADFNRIPGAVVRSCPKSGNFRVEDNARTSRQRTSSASLITGTPTAGRNELFNREITRNFRRLGSRNALHRGRSTIPFPGGYVTARSQTNLRGSRITRAKERKHRIPFDSLTVLPNK